MVRSGQWQGEAGYSDGGRVWWLYGGIAVVSLVSWGLMALGVELQQGVAAWLWPVVLVAFAVLGTRAMMPKVGRLVLEGDVLRIERGRRVTELRRPSLTAAVRDWAPVRGYELGSALVLSDGATSVSLGIRDRRLAGADGICRTPEIWIEGSVADDQLPRLEIDREIVNPDAPSPSVLAGLTFTLLRNPNRLGPIVGLVGGMFGGMLGVGLFAFAMEAAFGTDASWLMLLILPSIFAPFAAHLTYQRRGKVLLRVADGRLTLTRNARSDHHPLDTLVFHRGHVSMHARGYGEYETPTLAIELPAGKTLVIGTSDVRLRWKTPGPRRRAAPLLASPLDFRLLVAALGLGRTLTVDSTREPAQRWRR